jgi:hypothetical protein
MFSHDTVSKIKKAREEVVDSITEAYKEELFGLPPKKNTSGRLEGATPPNMEFITKLYSNGR